MTTEIYKAHKKELLRACEQSQGEHDSYTISQGDILDSNITPLEHAYNRYMSELYPYSSVQDWLQGLALDVEYNYYDIAIMFDESNIITEDNKGEYLSYITDDYWRDMASVLEDLWNIEGLII